MAPKAGPLARALAAARGRADIQPPWVSDDDALAAAVAQSLVLAGPADEPEPQQAAPVYSSTGKLAYAVWQAGDVAPPCQCGCGRSVIGVHVADPPNGPVAFRGIARSLGRGYRRGTDHLRGYESQTAAIAGFAEDADRYNLDRHPHAHTWR